MATIIKAVSASEQEIGLGIYATTTAHWLVSIGEYADQGDADIDIRVLAAVDEGGNDISEKVAVAVAAAVEAAIEKGSI